VELRISEGQILGLPNLVSVRSSWPAQTVRLISGAVLFQGYKRASQDTVWLRRLRPSPTRSRYLLRFHRRVVPTQCLIKLLQKRRVLVNSDIKVPEMPWAGEGELAELIEDRKRLEIYLTIGA
jgi:hypothetical protein